MKILYRILLVLSLGYFGFILGLLLGAIYLVPKNSGLAGGPMVLGYGLLGLIIFSIFAIVMGLKLPLKKLPAVSLVLFISTLALFVGHVVSFKNFHKSKLDPESDYKNIPAYSVSVEQLVIVDPYLSTKHVVDSKKRRWENTLPDGRVCSAVLRANTQREIAEALKDLAEIQQSALDQCRKSSAQAERLLTWNLLESSEANARGEIKISTECLNSQPLLSAVVNKTIRASLSSNTSVKCK